MLTFRGPPILSPTRGTIRFTAYRADPSIPNVVICNVTRGALAYLCENPKINAEGMLSAYNAHIHRIRAAACTAFDAGELEPFITEETLKVWDRCDKKDA